MMQATGAHNKALYERLIRGTGVAQPRYGRVINHRLTYAAQALRDHAGETPRVVTELGCGAGQYLKALVGGYSEARGLGFDFSLPALQAGKKSDDVTRVCFCMGDIVHERVGSGCGIRAIRGHSILIRSCHPLQYTLR
jgi:SAM-dependent methyltransferase